MIDIGGMRDVVRIERRSATQDSVGEQLLVWEHFARRRCSIVATPGAERWGGEQRLGRVPTTFELRFLEGVMPGMRLVVPAYPPKIPKDKFYNILSAIDPDSSRRKLVITAEELVEAVS